VACWSAGEQFREAEIMPESAVSFQCVVRTSPHFGAAKTDRDDAFQRIIATDVTKPASEPIEKTASGLKTLVSRRVLTVSIDSH